MMDFEKCMHKTNWKHDANRGIESFQVITTFRGTIEDGNVLYSYFYKNLIIDNNTDELIKKQNQKETVTKLNDILQKSIGKGFLVILKSIPFTKYESDDSQYDEKIKHEDEEVSERQNRYFESVSERIVDDCFWIPATDIEYRDPITDEWKKIYELESPFLNELRKLKINVYNYSEIKYNENGIATTVKLIYEDEVISESSHWCSIYHKELSN